MTDDREEKLASDAYGPDAVERAVFEALADHEPAPCSLEELARIVGSRIHAHDGLHALQRDGLAHRAGELYMLTRAAVRARQLN